MKLLPNVGLARTAAQRRASMAAAGLIILSLAQPAAAQFVGFGRAANQPFTGEVSVVNKAGTKKMAYLRPVTAVNVRPAIEQAIWKVVGPNLANTIRTELPKKKFAGFTPYVIKLDAPTSRAKDRLYAGTDGTGLTLRYVVVGNLLRLGLHTPGPASRDANPVFDVPFEYEVIVDVETGSLTPLVRNVRIKLSVGRPRPVNETARAISAVNSVVSFFGGPDFLGKAQSRINGQERSVADPIGVSLGQLSRALQNAGNQVVIRPVMDRGALRLEMHRYTPPPVVR